MKNTLSLKKPDAIALVGIALVVLFCFNTHSLSPKLAIQIPRITALILAISVALAIVCYLNYKFQIGDHHSLTEYIVAKCILLFAAALFIIANLKLFSGGSLIAEIFCFTIGMFTFYFSSRDDISFVEEITKEPKKSFLQKLEL